MLKPKRTNGVPIKVARVSQLTYRERKTTIDYAIRDCVSDSKLRQTASRLIARSRWFRWSKAGLKSDTN